MHFPSSQPPLVLLLLLLFFINALLSSFSVVVAAPPPASSCSSPAPPLLLLLPCGASLFSATRRLRMFLAGASNYVACFGLKCRREANAGGDEGSGGRRLLSWNGYGVWQLVSFVFDCCQASFQLQINPLVSVASYSPSPSPTPHLPLIYALINWTDLSLPRRLSVRQFVSVQRATRATCNIVIIDIR